MFKLKLLAGDKKVIYKPLSLSIRFLIDEKKLKESFAQVEKILILRISEIQKKNFLREGTSEIRAYKKDGRPDEVLLHKIKVDDKFSADYFRNYFAGLIPSLEKEELKFLHIFIPKYDVFKNYFETEEYFYQSVIEGIFFGNYTFDKYLSDKKSLKDLTVHIYADDAKKLKSALSTSANLMKAVSITRDLQNEPANVITPQSLAAQVQKLFSGSSVKVNVFDEKEIAKRKMGGLLAVGSGSANPPRFIVMRYNGITAGGKNKTRNIAVVGKGVTFDSGGISIKPANNMGEMKADMSGAAVTIGILLAASKAKLPVNLTGIIPAAENMLSGNSMRPGDIVKTSSGKTIEVDNTDAEGRMILSDALHFASKEKPDVIIDLATLTGACVVALGEFVAGVFTKNDKLADDLYKAGMKTYDRVWRLPLWDDYNSLNKSDVADVKNDGGRWGGAISAAKFLENFVDKKLVWAHLDIAGPAFPNSINNYSKKLMTGFGVRLLFEYLSSVSSKK
ncbi:MAG: leucyl aminopeptidase [Ignavibacteriales bacterium]|nr:MAG: leucyl aminopeptidase [Ignavibacteriales bacterium]